jgi:hypothetical protein
VWQNSFECESGARGFSSKLAFALNSDLGGADFECDRTEREWVMRIKFSSCLALISELGVLIYSVTTTDVLLLIWGYWLSEVLIFRVTKQNENEWREWSFPHVSLSLWILKKVVLFCRVTTTPITSLAMKETMSGVLFCRVTTTIVPSS